MLFSYNLFAKLPKYLLMVDNLSLHKVILLEEDDIAEARSIVVLPREKATKPVSGFR